MCANISQTNSGRIIPCIHRGLLPFWSISSNSPILSLTTTMRKVGWVAASFVQSCSAGQRMPTARLQTLGLFTLTLCAMHRGGHELTDSGPITDCLGLYCCVDVLGLQSGGFLCLGALAPSTWASVVAACGFNCSAPNTDRHRCVLKEKKKPYVFPERQFF